MIVYNLTITLFPPSLLPFPQYLSLFQFINFNWMPMMCQALFCLFQAQRWRQRNGFQGCCCGQEDQEGRTGVGELRGEVTSWRCVSHLGAPVFKVELQRGRGRGYSQDNQQEIGGSYKSTRWCNPPGRTGEGGAVLDGAPGSTAC